MEAAESISRTSSEYLEGNTAHCNGKGESACPYRCGNKKRVGWFTGWYDADIQKRYGEIFTRHGITYP